MIWPEEVLSLKWKAASMTARVYPAYGLLWDNTLYRGSLRWLNYLPQMVLWKFEVPTTDDAVFIIGSLRWPNYLPPDAAVMQSEFVRVAGLKAIPKPETKLCTCSKACPLPNWKTHSICMHGIACPGCPKTHPACTDEYCTLQPQKWCATITCNKVILFYGRGWMEQLVRVASWSALDCRWHDQVAIDENCSSHMVQVAIYCMELLAVQLILLIWNHNSSAGKVYIYNCVFHCN